MRRIRAVLLALTTFGCLSYAYGGIEITAQTTECNGETGYTSFYSNRLYKIESADCTDPSGKRIMQVILRANSGLTNYDLVYVTESEAKKIKSQIDRGVDARLKGMSGQRDITLGIVGQPAGQPGASAAAGVSRPTIEILDPALTAHGDVKQAITNSSNHERIIVGKIISASGILSLTVNGVSVDADNAGLFKTRIPLGKDPERVTVVVVDKQGGRESLEFLLIRENSRQ